MDVKKESEMVDLDSFAEIAGFPVELIKKELFNQKDCGNEVAMADLRQAMLNYLDHTMFDETSNNNQLNSIFKLPLRVK